MSDKVWFSFPAVIKEVKDPPREACIITIEKGKEVSREYFGNNPRVEYTNER